jgi:hypothetical protein
MHLATAAHAKPHRSMCIDGNAFPLLIVTNYQRLARRQGFPVFVIATKDGEVTVD